MGIKMHTNQMPKHIKADAGALPSELEIKTTEGNLLTGPVYFSRVGSVYAVDSAHHPEAYDPRIDEMRFSLAELKNAGGCELLSFRVRKVWGEPCVYAPTCLEVERMGKTVQLEKINHIESFQDAMGYTRGNDRQLVKQETCIVLVPRDVAESIPGLL